MQMYAQASPLPFFGLWGTLLLALAGVASVAVADTRAAPATKAPSAIVSQPEIGGSAQ